MKQAAARARGRSEDVVKQRPRPACSCALEELQEEQIQKALEPKAKDVTLTPSRARGGARRCCATRTCSTASSPTSTACGVVGEETNKLVGYLAAVSRKLDEPLAVIIQS